MRWTEPATSEPAFLFLDTNVYTVTDQEGRSLVIPEDGDSPLIGLDHHAIAAINPQVRAYRDHLQEYVLAEALFRARGQKSELDDSAALVKYGIRERTIPRDVGSVQKQIYEFGARGAHEVESVEAEHLQASLRRALNDPSRNWREPSPEGLYAPPSDVDLALVADSIIYARARPGRSVQLRSNDQHIVWMNQVLDQLLRAHNKDWHVPENYSFERQPYCVLLEAERRAA